MDVKLPVKRRHKAKRTDTPQGSEHTILDWDFGRSCIQMVATHVTNGSVNYTAATQGSCFMRRVPVHPDDEVGYQWTGCKPAFK